MGQEQKKAAQEVPVLGQPKNNESAVSIKIRLLDMIKGNSKLLNLEEFTVQLDAYVKTHFPKIQSAQA